MNILNRNKLSFFRNIALIFSIMVSNANVSNAKSITTSHDVTDVTDVTDNK